MIAAFEAMTVERGASEAEARIAHAKLAKLREKEHGQRVDPPELKQPPADSPVAATATPATLSERRLNAVVGISRLAAVAFCFSMIVTLFQGAPLPSAVTTAIGLVAIPGTIWLAFIIRLRNIWYPEANRSEGVWDMEPAALAFGFYIVTTFRPDGHLNEEQGHVNFAAAIFLSAIGYAAAEWLTRASRKRPLSRTRSSL